MVKEGTNALNEYKSAVAKKRRKSHRLENLGIPVEELLKQQQELFAKVYFTQGCFFHIDPDQIFHPTWQKSGILITLTLAWQDENTFLFELLYLGKAMELKEYYFQAREEAFQKEQEEYKAAMAAAEASAAAVAGNSSSPPGTTSTKADNSERYAH